MKKLATLLAVLAIAGLATANADDVLTAGKASVKAPVIPSDDCTGDLVVNHDGTFENGYAWQGQGIAPPYFGAFGEGFLINGPKDVTCVAMYLTTLPGVYQGQLLDVYIWEGGVTSEPDAVIYLAVNQQPYDLPEWDEVGQNNFEVGLTDIDGEITVGYWGDYSEGAGFFIVVDELGPGGYPWTCYSPTCGYPEGWGHPNIVLQWESCKSLGFGVYLDEGLAQTESATWGSIKTLFE